MILPLVTELPQVNSNLFDCISNKAEYVIKSSNTVLIDYMISAYPRNENVSTFDFVYSLVEPNRVVFSNNQDTILSIATELFARAKPLSSFESEVLNKTFNRLLKSNPTLAGRK